MGLSNAAKRARYYNQTINQDQGGGNKKAGLPQQVGKDSWTSIFIHATDPVHGKCCSQPQQMYMKFAQSNYQARPVGGNINNAGYYKVD